MAEQASARRRAPATSHVDINDWMKRRNAQVHAAREAEAAGRRVWANSTRTGENLLAAHASDILALGRQTASHSVSGHGAHDTAVDGAIEFLHQFQKAKPMPQPSWWQSMIPVVGPGWEFLADVQKEHYGHAALDAGVGLLDAQVGKAIIKGGMKVRAGKAFYVPQKEKALEASFDWKKKVRPWMEAQDYLKPSQHGHHWFVPQNGWGKSISKKIKNQPWNIMAMPDEVTHGRLHHRVGDSPRFNALERYWHGTPNWWKALTGAPAAHGVMATQSRQDRPK